MAKATITRAMMRDLPPPPEGSTKTRIFDDRLPGFIAERRQTGTTFYYRYTDHRRRSREVKLGRLGDVTVDQARRQAEQLRSSVSMGADPVAEKAKLRAVPVLAAFVRDRYLPHAQDTMRSAGNVEAYLRLRILPSLGRKALDEITQDDVAALRRRLVDAGLANGTVNRHPAVTVQPGPEVAAIRRSQPGRVARNAAGGSPRALPVNGQDAGAGAGAGPGLCGGAGNADRHRRAQKRGSAGDLGPGRLRPGHAHRAAVEERPAAARPAVAGGGGHPAAPAVPARR
jgi:hypothetical protein